MAGSDPANATGPGKRANADGGGPEGPRSGASRRAFVDGRVKAMGMAGISNSRVPQPCEKTDGKVKAVLNRPREGTALPVNRRDLPQGPARWAHRVGRRHHRHRGEQRRPPRGSGLGDGRFQSRADPEHVPAQAQAARPAGREAGDRRRPRGGARPPSRRSWAQAGSAVASHFRRNALAKAGRSGRRVVCAFIATAFARGGAVAASTRWRAVAGRIRARVPKIVTLMDRVGHGVSACMSFSPANTGPGCTAATRSSGGTAGSGTAQSQQASSRMTTPSSAPPARCTLNRRGSGPSSGQDR